MFNLAPLPRTLDAALRDLEHRKPEVRASAVSDLAARLKETPDARGSAALLDALKDASPSVRKKAALALADAGIKESREPLLALLEDPEMQVREMALVALGELCDASDERVARAIRSALAAEHPELRFQALIAHTRLLGVQTLPHLARAFTDSDVHVRYVALRLAEECLSSDERAPHRTTVHDAAREALADAARGVRLAAAILLAKTRDAEAEAELVASVNSRTPIREPEDEQAAIELIGELGLAAARPGLERRAFGGLVSRDRFAWHARVALAKLGDDRARQSILRDLRSWSFETRTLAVVAAGRAKIREAYALVSAMRNQPLRADPLAVNETLALLA